MPRNTLGQFSVKQPVPCPWCGEAPTTEEVCGRGKWNTLVGQGIYFTECSCGARGPALATRLDAVNEWDRVASV